MTLRMGSVNVGTMRGHEGEVVEMAASRHLDFCCLQETGWKSEGSRKLGVISSFGWGVNVDGEMLLEFADALDFAIVCVQEGGEKGDHV